MVCIRLTTITVPAGITNIDAAFQNCTSLQAVNFMGNAPAINTWAAASPFIGSTPTVYYLPGTSGWGPTFAGRPTALWSLLNPLILTHNTLFGARSNGFGFAISWATNVPVIVENCTNLANPDWRPLQTNILSNGLSYFIDPQWANNPTRFYRVRSP
jgi:hypothetical protein